MNFRRLSMCRDLRCMYQMRMQDQRRGGLTTAAFQVWLVGGQTQARMVYPWTSAKHRAVCRLMMWG